MATGGGLTYSRINASDEVIDYACSPCTKKNKTSDAMKYCVECQEYLCTSCVDNHNSFSALSGHSLLGRSQFGTSCGTVDSNLPSVPTERCKVQTKLVDMYCGNHDTVGCSVCFNISHKTCEDIHYIPDYVQKQTPTSQFSHLQSQLDTTIFGMETLARKHQQLKVKLKKERDNSYKRIISFRAEIKRTIDQLDQATIKDLDDRFCTLGQMVEDEKDAIQKTLGDLRKQKVSAASSDVNTSQKFVSLKLGQTDIREAENLITGGSLSIPNDILQFDKKSEILYFLRSFDSLHKPQHQSIKQRVLPPRKKDSLYQVKSKDSFNIMVPEGQKSCDSCSMCMLECGDILVADRENKILKKVDVERNRIKSFLELPHEPNSVCTYDSEEAIVSLENKSLQFVGIQGGLNLTRQLQAKHGCLCVSVFASWICVTDGKNRNIFKHGLTGVQLGKISCKEFSWNRHIVGDAKEKTMYVTDRDKGLFKLDVEGNIIWNISGKVLKDPHDLCTDGLGNVFVADIGSKTVVQVTSDGKCLGNVVENVSGERSVGVCFDSKESKLFVSSGNDIEVYALE